MTTTGPTPADEGLTEPTFDPTTDYWQSIHTAESLPISPDPPYHRGYPARLPNNQFLILPLRGLPNDPHRCVASLIANQASISVVESLAQVMAQRSKPFSPDFVVGLPTLGLAFAPLVAKHLGHTRYIPFGYSRKYWYTNELAIPVNSITTPEQGKLLFVDPNLAGMLKGKRVLVVDDAVSSGQTMAAALKLLERCEARIVGIAVAMRQGMRWKDVLVDEEGKEIPLAWVFDSPRMVWRDGGWYPEPLN